MILMLLALAQATAPAMPPPDWSGLPLLQFRRPAETGPDLSSFVRDEVQNGRCASTTSAGPSASLRVDLAVLANGAGQVLRIVPRAIDCPTVEQYAAGLMSRMARDNIDSRGAAGEAWYRTSITFAWTG